MIQPTLTAIKDYILAANQYFSKGFDDVYMDLSVGIVGNDKTAVFPEDTNGDYFYLRLPQQVRFDYAALSAISDCSNTPLIDAEITLVACVRKADPDVLLVNLANTVSSFNENVRFTAARYRSEDVVVQELARMKKENIDAALKRVGNYTIVSLTFHILVPFQLRKVSTDCILDPCKC